jgi:photosystem II stability/assembly factor-like uncharacterized protein
MKRLSSTLRICLPQTGLVLLVGAVLTTLPAVAQTALTDQDKNNIAVSHSKNPAADVGRWVSIGPEVLPNGSGPLGSVGRLHSIAIDPTSPSTMYVGAPGSGVWKTTNGGAVWQPITDSLPTLAIPAIAVDPSAPSRVYVALPGFGVFRSQDGGTSWVQISNDLQAEARWGVLLVHPTNPNVIYLTSALGIYRSGDFGATWQLSKSGGRGTGLVMNPASPNILYAAIFGDGIYQTTDGGAQGNSSWRKLTGGLPTTDINQITLALCRTVPGTVYAAYSRSVGLELYRTTDAGNTWQLRSTPSQSFSGLYNDVIGVDANNPDIVYVTGVDFYRSTNGGINFQLKGGPHVDHHGFATDPVTPGLIYALSDGGIYRSANRGDDWTFIGEGIANIEFYDIASAFTEPTLVIGGTQDNGNVKRDDSNTVWRVTGRFGDGATVDIDPTNARILYAMSQYVSSISRSTDGGSNWANIARGLPTGAVCFNAHFQVHPTTPTTLLASCNSLWRTTTSAPPGDWQPIFTPPSGSIVRSAVDATVDLYYAGTNQGGLFAGPAGANWQRVFGHPSNAGMTDIEVDPPDPATVYTSFGGTGTGRVYRLTRSSPTPTTMTAVDITADLPSGLRVSAVAVDRVAPLTIYAGTNQGVYRGHSTDSGVTWSWTPYNNGLPGGANITELEFHPLTDVMRAATLGRSAFEVNTSELSSNDVVFVNRANTGSEDGTFEHPFNTVAEGRDHSAPGGILVIITGNYPESNLTFTRALTLKALRGTVIIGK